MSKRKPTKIQGIGLDRCSHTQRLRQVSTHTHTHTYEAIQDLNVREYSVYSQGNTVNQEIRNIYNRREKIPQNNKMILSLIWAVESNRYALLWILLLTVKYKVQKERSKTRSF